MEGKIKSLLLPASRLRLQFFVLDIILRFIFLAQVSSEYENNRCVGIANFCIGILDDAECHNLCLVATFSSNAGSSVSFM